MTYGIKVWQKEGSRTIDQGIWIILRYDIGTLGPQLLSGDHYTRPASTKTR